MEKCEIWKINPDFQHKHLILFRSHQSVVIMFWLVSVLLQQSLVVFCRKWVESHFYHRKKENLQLHFTLCGRSHCRWKKEQIYAEKPGNFEISLRTFLPKILKIFETKQGNYWIKKILFTGNLLEDFWLSRMIWASKIESFWVLKLRNFYIFFLKHFWG